TRNRTRKAIATTVRASRLARPSVVAFAARPRMAWLVTMAASACMAEPPAAPDLDQVDEKQHGEGDGEHDCGQRGCARIVELLQPDHDQKRRDLRYVGDVAGDEDDRPVFPHRTGKGEG